MFRPIYRQEIRATRVDVLAYAVGQSVVDVYDRAHEQQVDMVLRRGGEAGSVVKQAREVEEKVDEVLFEDGTGVDVVERISVWDKWCYMEYEEIEDVDGRDVDEL